MTCFNHKCGTQFGREKRLGYVIKEPVYFYGIEILRIHNKMGSNEGKLKRCEVGYTKIQSEPKIDTNQLG